MSSSQKSVGSLVVTRGLEWRIKLMLLKGYEHALSSKEVTERDLMYSIITVDKTLYYNHGM